MLAQLTCGFGKLFFFHEALLVRIFQAFLELLLVRIALTGLDTNGSQLATD